MKHDETLEEIKAARPRSSGPPRPGLLLVFSATSPVTSALPLGGGALDVGREAAGLSALHDPLLSRRHARVEHRDGGFTVRDVGSRNGTAVGGESITGVVTAEPGQIIRTGGTIFVLCADVGPYLRGVTLTADAVIGPTLRDAYEAIARAARHSSTLYLHGESGAGKEQAARAFHAAGPSAKGPFIAVNCAAIPEGVAERLLFGAKKGAYSGASADADGYVRAADGGTLFLDEVGDLQREVQAKLLRVLETREVLALGASSPRRVDVRICSASHRDLRAEVVLGRFREDLYFRIGRPEVALPPLRARPEEIPWLLEREVRRVDPALELTASLVEACLLRPWPGNVRELLVEARVAALDALATSSRQVTGAHLPRNAGLPLAPAPGTQRPVEHRPRRRGAPGKEELLALMEKHGRIVKEVALELGCSRRQVGRWLDQHEILRKRPR